MYARKDNSRFWKWAVLFFILMAVFTLLSRALYQRGVAVVYTQSPTGGTIAHSIQVPGKTVQNQELAVTTVSGLRIASVSVNEGQQVREGDVLFALDLDYLAEQILCQQQEMQKQKLAIQAAWSQDSVSAQQRSNAQAQASENYDSAVSQSQTALDRAKRDLDRAKAALEAFYNGTSAGKAEEEILTAACQAAKSRYDAAVLAQQQLQAEVEAKVNEAIDAANQEPPPEPEPEDPAALAVPAARTPADPEQIAQAVRDSYAPALAEAQSAVDQARNAMADADAALEAFRQSQSNAPVRSEQELQDAVETAQEAYDDAYARLESNKTTYGRAIQSASLPNSTSNTAQIGQITYDQMALALEKLEALQAAEGKILSPADGIVTKSLVQTGQKTTDATAMLLADLSLGCKFSGLVTQEQSQYIGVGDIVTIQSGSKEKRYKDLPVTTFSATEEAGGGYQITVQLPPESLSLGASAELLFTQKSQPYGCCVPLSALRLDERNEAYVLTVEEVDTVLGPQLQAKKVSVTVLDKNETTAALAEGAVGREMKIIVRSEKAVDIGSRVRIG